ncbi:MAG: hypothetical protein L0221_00755 [Chloroflexi bacterium]|nr:hypothetical protein [Chloroflexota bacterium]
MTISPAPVLAFLVAVFHTAIFVLIRNDAGGRRLPILVIAAFFGAWAGDALGARLELEILTLGDFHLLTASLVAWLAISVVVIVGVLAPTGSPYARRGPTR